MKKNKNYFFISIQEYGFFYARGRYDVIIYKEIIYDSRHIRLEPTTEQLKR